MSVYIILVLINHVCVSMFFFQVAFRVGLRKVVSLVAFLYESDPDDVEAVRI